MSEYNDNKKIIRELNEVGKHLLRNFYTGCFTENTSEFQHLLEEIRFIWGLDRYDKLEDTMIIEYVNQNKEIQNMKNDVYNYNLVETLASVNSLNPYELTNDKYKEYQEEHQSIGMGKEIYKYILKHPNDNFVFKILKERYIDYSLFNDIRQERIRCFIFKVNKTTYNYE